MEHTVTKEEQYDLWLQFKPMWSKWAYKMAMVDNEKSDWEQESYMVLGEAIKTYKEGYGVAFSAYYRMLLYRYGKKMINKHRDLLVYEQEDIGAGYEVADECVAVEEQVVERQWEEERGSLIQIVLGRLKPKDRQIIEAIYLYQKPIASLAKEQGVSYDAIECKKRRILKKLRTLLAQSDGIEKQLTI